MIDLRTPPKWPLKILKVVCPSALLEEIEGDVTQKFMRDQVNLGYRIARRRMIMNVFRFIRPGIILRNKISISLISTFMIPYYFRMAWRNIAGSKFYSSLNMLGLTLGLSVGLLILLWVNNEMSYDSFHSKADKIFHLNTRLESNGEKFTVHVTQPAIGARAMTEVPGIESVVRVSTENTWSIFRYNDLTLKANTLVFVDPSFFTMFDFELIKGDKNHPFNDANSVVLTQSEAKRFFGGQDPIGKTLIADNRDNLVVSGVLKDFPANSSIEGQMLFSTELQKKIAKDNGWRDFDDNWGNYGWNTFLQLQQGVSISDIEDKLSKINHTHQPSMRPADVGYYKLQPLKDIHLYAPDGKPVVLRTVRTFSLVAILILVIAAINYVNLTTARALVRSKEVSVRKVIGATRRQLFNQFVVHTCLFFFIAVVLAFGVMALAMPLYNNIAGKSLQFNPLDLNLWKVIGITLACVLIASSVYPASLLSSFNPVQSLKSKFSFGKGSTVFRRTLVVGQFAFSIGLIICTTIIGRQLNFMLESDLGFDKSNVFTVQMDEMSDHYESAKNELLTNPAITSVTSGHGDIVSRWGATLDIDWDGKDPNQTYFFHDMKVDKDFIEMFKMKVLEGANFTGNTADSSHFIVNETAVDQMGIKNPVGKRFRWHQIDGTIIGVVKDFNYTPLSNSIQPFVFIHQPSNDILYVKADNRSMPEAIAAVQKIWTQYNPGSPFSYTFVDDTYNKHYASDQRTNRLYTLFTGIAIVISCLGLLGLITYTAQLKVKEIGIRKVLGATVPNIVMLLSKSFMLLITISMALAIPASWWIMKGWLTRFAYQTTVPWWLYGISCVAAILITLITIGFQAVRAAIENPVRSLRE
ncbi:MAG: ABC transporter permease [Bacteroidota bacterium]